MTDGLECESISVETADCLRAEGYTGLLPAFVAHITRRDGEVISMQVLCMAHLRGLIETLAPDRSTVMIRHGPDDDVKTLVDVLSARITVH